MAEPAAPAPGRQRVLDAAAERLVEQGYAATTLRQLAADAGIKAGSVYHHFASKEDLFIAVFNRGIEVMVEAFDRVEAVEPLERLGAHVRAHLGALFEHGSYTAAHVTAFFTAPSEVRAEVVPQRDEYEHRWTDLLADVFPDLPADRRPLTRLLLFGSMNTTIEWFHLSGSLSLDDLAAIITSQFVDGIHASHPIRSAR